MPEKIVDEIGKLSYSLPQSFVESLQPLGGDSGQITGQTAPMGNSAPQRITGNYTPPTQPENPLNRMLYEASGIPDKYGRTVLNNTLNNTTPVASSLIYGSKGQEILNNVNQSLNTLSAKRPFTYEFMKHSIYENSWLFILPRDDQEMTEMTVR